MSTDPQPTRPTVPEMREQLQALPGQRIVDAIQALEIPIKYVLLPNGQQLDRHLAVYDEGSLGEAPQSPQHHEVMDAYLGEAHRLTHNLLAAVKTVVDHTRNVLRENWAEGHPVRVEYEEAKKIFVTDGHLVVVQDLRNFFLHCAHPGIEAHTKWNVNSGWAHSVRLKTDSLLQWNSLKSVARTYLQEAGVAVELRPLARNYLERAVALHTTVIQSINTHELESLAPWIALAQTHDAHVEEVNRRVWGPSQDE